MSKILMVNGPSGAGKTTATKAFLAHAAGEWAYVGQDDAHGLIVTGYRSANGMPDTWDVDVRRQWELSIALCCDMIRRFYEYGVNCAVDFFAPPAEFRQWQQKLGAIPYTHVVLLPSLSVTLARNNGRSGTSRLSDKKIQANYADFSNQAHTNDTHVIDSSMLSPDAVAGFLKKL